MTDVISYMKQRRALRKDATAAQKSAKQEDIGTLEYNDRLHIRALVSLFGGFVKVLLVTTLPLAAIIVVAISAVSDYDRIRQRSNGVDDVFIGMIEALKSQLGFTDAGIATVFTITISIVLLIVVVLLVATTYPRLKAWWESRIVINSEIFRVENREIFKTGSNTEFSSSVIKGSTISKSFLDRLFINCGTVEVFMSDMSGNNDAKILKFVRNPEKMQRVIRQIQSRTEK